MNQTANQTRIQSATVSPYELGGQVTTYWSGETELFAASSRQQSDAERLSKLISPVPKKRGTEAAVACGHNGAEPEETEHSWQLHFKLNGRNDWAPAHRGGLFYGSKARSATVVLQHYYTASALK